MIKEIKENKMGHKGVSKRKPKQNKYKIDVNTSSDLRPGESPSVQGLVKDKDTSVNKGGVNPYAGSNKKGKKDRR
jgi:hypothetical protein